MLKKDAGAILRLLYLESKRNSNLLLCIKSDSRNKNTSKQEFKFKDIIVALKIEVLELIFMAGKSNSKVFDFMKNSSEFELDEDENNDSETPLNALSFLYVKIWTVKKLVSISKNEALKNQIKEYSVGI